MPDYHYVTSLNRYRDVATGQFVAREAVLDYVDRITRSGSNASGVLADLVSDGTLSPADFGQRLKDELKSADIQAYILGRGGRDLMQPRDWGALGNMLKPEYARINQFVADIEAGDLTPGQIRARAALYFQRAREGYERGHARAHDLPTLPAYPGDGTSECMNGCLCRWNHVKLDGEGNVDSFWEAQPIEPCPTCLERSIAWAPLQTRGGVLQPYRHIRASAHHHHEHEVTA
jgi:hypothetical protein